MRGKMTMFVVLIVVGLATPAVVSDNDSLTIEYQFSAVQKSDCCDPLLIENTILREIPREPLVPYFTAQILLPQGTDVKDIKVKPGTSMKLTGYDIPWGQIPYMSGDAPQKVDRNEEIYESNNEYPGTLFDVSSPQFFRGFKILPLNLYPQQYQPKSETVTFYETLTVEIKVCNGEKNPLYRGLPGDKKEVADIVDNPEIVDTYEDIPQPLIFQDYVIITNEELEPTFEQLAIWKSSFVNMVDYVYTLSSIRATEPGRDDQEKIRNFIKDFYSMFGTRYVLLGGDVSVVPYRGFFVTDFFGHTDTDIEADMYYAHLDGTWNADNDGLWGEKTDGIDWYPEVAVGRAPVETVEEAQAFVNKVIAYEQAEKPKVCQFHAARINCDNNPDSRCLPYNCDDWVPLDYTKKYLLETDQTVTKELWEDAWDGINGEPHTAPLIFQHMGQEILPAMYSSTCDNSTSYGINACSEVLWENSDIGSLTNRFWPIHTSPSSFVGQFECNECLAETYVKDDNGAIACYMSSTYGAYSLSDACHYSGEFVEMQFKALFNDGKEKLGDLLNQSKILMVPMVYGSTHYYRYSFYGINLIGDPETPCLTKRVCTEISSPLDGLYVCTRGTVTITANTITYIDTVKFYVIWIENGILHGDLLCTDTTSPFECSWVTSSYSEGWYTIRTESYHSGELQDFDEITIYIYVC
ncbi:MAG: hypothetical protein HXS41_08260 [Theionarchaea archaeon]|nr:hypothetical protein [Theionarchaea archaeon]